MIDNRLYQVRKWTQDLLQPMGGETIQVLKFEIRTLLTEREFMPVFERSGGAMYALSSDGAHVVQVSQPHRGLCRVTCPMFSYDREAGGKVVGAEFPMTLDALMRAVVEAMKEEAETTQVEEGEFVHFQFFFAGSEKHIMAYIPAFDKMEWYFMVRANLVEMSAR